MFRYIPDMGENLTITTQQLHSILSDLYLNGITDLVSETPFNWYEQTFIKAAKPTPLLTPQTNKPVVTKALPSAKKPKKPLQEATLTPDQCIWTIGPSKAPLTLLTAALPHQFGHMPFTQEETTLLTNILKTLNLTINDINMAVTTATCSEGVPLSAKQIKQLHSFAQQQLDRLEPQKILAFGQVPLNVFYNNDHVPLTKLRQEQPQIKVPTVTTYHPKHLLKTPLLKKRTWQDLQPLVTLFAQ